MVKDLHLNIFLIRQPFTIFVVARFSDSCFHTKYLKQREEKMSFTNAVQNFIYQNNKPL